MSVALYRSSRLALIANILLAGLLMDQLQALQQGKADAVWDTNDMQLKVNFVLQRFYHQSSFEQIIQTCMCMYLQKCCTVLYIECMHLCSVMVGLSTWGGLKRT